jgi:hypothetical protein
VRFLFHSAKNRKAIVKPQDMGDPPLRLADAVNLCNLSKPTSVPSPLGPLLLLSTDLFTDFVEYKFGQTKCDARGPMIERALLTLSRLAPSRCTLSHFSGRQPHSLRGYSRVCRSRHGLNTIPRISGGPPAPAPSTAHCLLPPLFTGT